MTSAIGVLTHASYNALQRKGCSCRHRSRGCGDPIPPTLWYMLPCGVDFKGCGDIPYLVDCVTYHHVELIPTAAVLCHASCTMLRIVTTSH